MAEYEMILTGEDLQGRLNTLCVIEPGVYGKRWNPDGSLVVLVRSARTAEDLAAALTAAQEKITAPPAKRGRRPDEAEG